jgi:hypothetical protein
VTYRTGKFEWSQECNNSNFINIQDIVILHFILHVKMKLNVNQGDDSIGRRDKRVVTIHNHFKSLHFKQILLARKKCNKFFDVQKRNSISCAILASNLVVTTG